MAWPLAGAFTSAAAAAKQDEDAARTITPGAPQIFVDLKTVASMENVKQLFHQAKKHVANPVLRGEKPWEAFAYSPTAGFIRDDEDGLFKCWYMGLLGDKAGPVHSYGKHVLCYATSKDGVKWNRPSLGLHEYEGSKENNIVIPPTYHDGKDHWESVMKDPLDPDPKRRYKGFGWSSHTNGLHTMWSPDGLNWKHSPDVVVPGGDAQSMMIDARNKQYVIFVRHPRKTYVSKDFVQWEDPVDCFQWPGPGSIYNLKGFQYGDSYLGLLSYYQTHNQHLMDTRLLASDGRRFWLPNDKTLTELPALIPMGEYGDWDRFQTRLTGADPISVGDELFIYYRGFNTSHDKEHFPDDNYFAGALGLATLRLDGFASLAAGFNGGTVTTTPFVCPGGNATVNVKSDHHGALTADVLDERGAVIEPFAAAECIPVSADDVRAEVIWKSRKNLDELKGRPISLRFHLKNARLYAYRIG